MQQEKTPREKLEELKAFYDASWKNQNSAVAWANSPAVKEMLAKLDRKETLDEDDIEKIGRWYEEMLKRKKGTQGARRRRGKPTKKKVRRGKRATRRTRSA